MNERECLFYILGILGEPNNASEASFVSTALIDEIRKRIKKTLFPSSAVVYEPVNDYQKKVAKDLWDKYKNVKACEGFYWLNKCDQPNTSWHKAPKDWQKIVLKETPND
jgi:hypothetical protein